MKTSDRTINITNELYICKSEKPFQISTFILALAVAGTLLIGTLSVID